MNLKAMDDGTFKNNDPDALRQMGVAGNKVAEDFWKETVAESTEMSDFHQRFNRRIFTWVADKFGKPKQPR